MGRVVGDGVDLEGQALVILPEPEAALGAVAQHVLHQLFVVQHGEQVLVAGEELAGRPALDDLAEAAQVLAGGVPGEDVATETSPPSLPLAAQSSSGLRMMRVSLLSMIEPSTEK